MSSFKKELTAFFKTPAAYIYGAVILVVVGISTITNNLTQSLANFEYAVDASGYVFLILAPFFTLYLHSRLHEWPKKALKDQPENVAEETAAEETEGGEARTASGKDRFLAVTKVSLLMLLIPTVLLILYPLVLSTYGNLYLPTALSEIITFFFLGLTSLSICLAAAVTEEKSWAAGLASLLTHLLLYFITDLANFCTTPYASMLLFTVVIALLGLTCYRITRDNTVSLGLVVILEILQVIFFLFRQSAFTYLASAVFSLVSPFERFRLAAGGILDIPGLLYMASFAVVLVLLCAVAQTIKENAAKAEAAKAEEAKGKFSAGKKSETDNPGGSSVPDTTLSLQNSKPYALVGIVLCCLILLNVGARLTRGALIIDTTSTHLYTPGEQFKNELKNLKWDVTVHWVVQNGQEDATVRTALYVYSSMNPHLQVRRLNPNVSADFIQENTIEDIYNNGLLVMSEGRSRYINFEDLFSYDYSHYQETGSYDMLFNLEDQLDHALEFVAGSELGKLYATTGHDEGTLPEYFNAIFQKEDLEVITFDISKGIPEDADCLLILGPGMDFTEEEADNLSLYLRDGGRLLLVTRLHEDGQNLNNLESVMLEYGGVLIPGVVMESGSNAYNSSIPYNIRPNVMEHEVNSNLVASRKAPVLSIAQGIMLMPAEGVRSSALLVTSDEAYSKLAGYDSYTYDMEDGDVQGILVVAAAFESEADARIVWVTSGSIIAVDTNDESGAGNQYFLTGALEYLNPELSHTTIPGTKYNYGVLWFKGEAVTRLSVLLAFVIPMVYLAIGLIFFLLKKRQEAIAKEEAEEAARLQEEEERRRQEEEEAARREAFKKAREEAARAAKESAKKAAQEAAKKRAEKK